MYEGLWESGSYVVFEYPTTRNIRPWGWRDWEELNVKELWKREVEINIVWVSWDCMEVFFIAIAEALRLDRNQESA